MKKQSLIIIATIILMAEMLCYGDFNFADPTPLEGIRCNGVTKGLADTKFKALMEAKANAKKSAQNIFILNPVTIFGFLLVHPNVSNMFPLSFGGNVPSLIFVRGLK